MQVQGVAPRGVTMRTAKGVTIVSMPDEVDLPEQESSCCEYVNSRGVQRHVCQCFCECEDVDKSLDACLCCKCGGTGGAGGVHQIARALRDVQDRIRVPWPGGAINVDIGVVLPGLVMRGLRQAARDWTPTHFPYIAAANLVLFALLGGLHVCALAVGGRSRFFLCWLLWSMLFLYRDYARLVGPSQPPAALAALHLLLGLSALYLQRAARADTGDCGGADAASIHSCTAAAAPPPPTPACTGGRGYCRICEAAVPLRDHHCVWINGCVGAHNHRAFCAFLACGAALCFAFAAQVHGRGCAACTGGLWGEPAGGSSLGGGSAAGGGGSSGSGGAGGAGETGGRVWGWGRRGGEGAEDASMLLAEQVYAGMLGAATALLGAQQAMHVAAGRLVSGGGGGGGVGRAGRWPAVWSADGLRNCRLFWRGRREGENARAAGAGVGVGRDGSGSGSGSGSARASAARSAPDLETGALALVGDPVRLQRGEPPAASALARM